MDRGAWEAVLHGDVKVRHDLATQLQQITGYIIQSILHTLVQVIF